MLKSIKNLRDLFGVIAAYCRLESAMIDELENHAQRLYALEENQKTDKATRHDLMQRVGKVELAVNGKVRIPISAPGDSAKV